MRLDGVTDAILPVLLVGVFLSTGCTNGSRRNVTPLTEAGPDYFGSRSMSVREKTDRPWWETFQDRTLNQLVREALANNLELQSIGARIARADATLRQAGGRLFPQIDGTGSYGVRSVGA
ncbi:MAG: TolC family protein, partial [Verrucomicrobiota bacterium]